jgi:hypothetical protein
VKEGKKERGEEKTPPPLLSIARVGDQAFCSFAFSSFPHPVIPSHLSTF